MTNKMLIMAVASALLATGECAQAACEGLAKVLETVAAERTKLGQAVADGAKQLSQVPQLNSQECRSLTPVIHLVLRYRVTGRKLEEDRALDEEAAGAELSEAMQNPEVAERLEPSRLQEMTEQVRMLYQIVILHEQNYLDARNLVIEQLREQMRK